MKKILILMLLMMSMVFSQTAEEGFINGEFFVPNGETTLSDLLNILQSADNDGIKIRGYDDKTGDSLMINITASGSMLMISTTAMDIEAATGDVNLTATVGSIINKLGDNAGVQTFDVRDSDGNVVITANSDGSLSIDGTFSTAGGMTADQVRGVELGAPTYDDVQDWMNTTQSSGITSGGGFTSNGDGTVTVAAGTGFIRATNSDIAEVLYFDWAADASLALTDASTNYIYVSYNAGTPDIVATLTKTDADNRTKILLGKIFRDGTTLHPVEAGMVTTELAKRVLTYLNALNGEIVRFTGLAITETGTLNIDMTAGTGSAGLTPNSWSAINTSGADDFTYWYNDGAWQSSTVSAIDNLQYNNYGVGLVTLSNNQYGVHWAYLDFDGHLNVVYGLDSYTLAGTQDADEPENLPDIVKDFCLLVARITIAKSEASSFTDVDSPWEAKITSSTVTDHGALGGLGDDDHTQYLLEDGTRDISGVINHNAGMTTKNGGVSSGYLDFYESSVDGTNYQKVKAGSMSGNLTLTLPSDAGANGYVLETNGVGVTSWVAVASGGDFSDGGEAGGAARTLGNTDAYAMGFETNNVERAQFTSAGHFLPLANATYDLGASGAYWNNFYAWIGYIPSLYTDMILNKDDADTRITFTTDKIGYNAGGVVFLEMTEDATDVFSFCELSDIDISSHSFDYNYGNYDWDWGTNVRTHYGANATVTHDAKTVTYASGTTTLYCDRGNYQFLTFGAGNITTLDFADMVASEVNEITLVITQDGTGSRVVTNWDAAIDWEGGTAPTLTTAANAADVLQFIVNGTGIIYGKLLSADVR